MISKDFNQIQIKFSIHMFEKNTKVSYYCSISDHLKFNHIATINVNRQGYIQTRWQ